MGQHHAVPSATPVCGRGQLSSQIASYMHDLPVSIPSPLIDIIVTYTGYCYWIIIGGTFLTHLLLLQQFTLACICIGTYGSGNDACTTLSIYEWGIDEWRFFTNMKIARSVCVAALVHDSLIVAGGKGCNDQRGGLMERLTLSTGTASTYRAISPPPPYA